MSEDQVRFEGLDPEIRPSYRIFVEANFLAQGMNAALKMIAVTDQEGNLVRDSAGLPRVKSKREIEAIFDDTKKVQELMRQGVMVSYQIAQADSTEIKFGPIIIGGGTYVSFNPLDRADFLRLHNRANSLDANLEVFNEAVDFYDLGRQKEALAAMNNVIRSMLKHEEDRRNQK